MQRARRGVGFQLDDGSLSIGRRRLPPDGHVWGGADAPRRGVGAERRRAVRLRCWRRFRAPIEQVEIAGVGVKTIAAPARGLPDHAEVVEELQALSDVGQGELERLGCRLGSDQRTTLQSRTWHGLAAKGYRQIL